jgi:Tat protein secretion system quality control protein TatD with DNase activity
VKFVAEKLAGIKAISLIEVAQATSTNADNLFGWRNFPSPINS